MVFSLRSWSPLAGDRGGYSWEFLVGVCHPVLQILTPFQTKQCHFPHRFQTWPLGRNYVIVAYIIAQRTNFFKCISNFGIETKNTFIHSCTCSSPENHTRFQTKMGKAYTHFQTKKDQKPYRLGRHILWLI